MLRDDPRHDPLADIVEPGHSVGRLATGNDALGDLAPFAKIELLAQPAAKAWPASEGRHRGAGIRAGALPSHSACPAQIHLHRLQRDHLSRGPTPTVPTSRGRAAPAKLSHRLVGKYVDHLPLYRQAEIVAREEIDLDRSTLCDWVGQPAWLLDPVAAVVRQIRLRRRQGPWPRHQRPRSQPRPPRRASGINQSSKRCHVVWANPLMFISQ